MLINNTLRYTIVTLLIFLLSACQASTVKIKEEISNKEHRVHLKIDNSKKRETILILHNCAGLTQHTRSWANQIEKWNYNAVILDSFYPYGYTRLCAGGTDAAIFSYNNSKDAEFIGKWIKQQPWSNGNVSVIGFSAGANTGILIATTPRSFEPSKIFDSVVSYYPNCFAGYQERNHTTPLLIHVGEKDNWINLGECKDMSQKSKFSNVEFQFYPNAEHSWDDGSSGTTKCWLGTCSWSYDREADKKSRQLTREFFEKHFRR
jgi:dienelactone hydrolase